jgi:hypothetical protein
MIPDQPISSPHSIPHSRHPALMRHATGTILLTLPASHTRHMMRHYTTLRSRLTALDYDTHGRAGTGQGMGKESLFLWQADPGTPLPHTAQRDSFQCIKPLSPEKLPFSYVNKNLWATMPYAIPNVLWFSLIVFLVLKYKSECLNCIFYYSQE